MVFLWGEQVKIDLKRMKIHPQESESFHFKEQGRDELLRDFGGRFVEPVEVNLLVNYSGEVFLGRGTLRTLLELPCSRCLDHFRYPVETEFSLVMAENAQPDTEEDVLLLQQGEADLCPTVEQCIFSEIPINPLCSENCQGICPECGVNKNQEACRCTEKPIDPRWEALKKLT